MVAAVVLTSASVEFNAARRVTVLPEGHRCRSLHGHGFRTSVFAELPAGWSRYPGGEVDALRRQLERCVAPLDYADLNTVVEQPTDENLARWIRSRLDVPGIERVAVQSTAAQGVDLDRNGFAHVWRRFRFQAAHQLTRVPAGHKCARMHGHSFEVIFHANQDLEGRPYSIDYDVIETAWAPLQEQLSYRCLNDVAGLENPTSENIAAWIWGRLKSTLPELTWVTVFETGACGANFDGSSYRIWKEFSMDCASRHARAPVGSARHRLHGHSYALRLHLSAPLDKVMGWTIDFGDVKSVFDPVFKSMDHHPLYELSGLGDADTASVARWVLENAKGGLPSLYRVDLHEAPGCGCIIAESVGAPLMPV